MEARGRDAPLRGGGGEGTECVARARAAVRGEAGVERGDRVGVGGDVGGLQPAVADRVRTDAGLVAEPVEQHAAAVRLDAGRTIGVGRERGDRDLGHPRPRVEVGGDPVVPGRVDLILHPGRRRLAEPGVEVDVDPALEHVVVLVGGGHLERDEVVGVARELRGAVVVVHRHVGGDVDAVGVARILVHRVPVDALVADITDVDVELVAATGGPVADRIRPAELGVLAVGDELELPQHRVDVVGHAVRARPGGARGVAEVGRIRCVETGRDVVDAEADARTGSAADPVRRHAAVVDVAVAARVGRSGHELLRAGTVARTEVGERDREVAVGQRHVTTGQLAALRLLDPLQRLARRRLAGVPRAGRGGSERQHGDRGERCRSPWSEAGRAQLHTGIVAGDGAGVGHGRGPAGAVADAAFVT